MKISAIGLTIALGTTSAFGMGSPDTLTSSELNIYSARKEALIKPLLDRFSEATGTQINLVTGKGDALLTRLQSEGINSPADLLLTVDAGRLYRAQQAGVLQPMISERLNAAIPQHLRSTDDQWFGLSVRARVIVYAKDRVGVEQLSNYEALAEPRWRGKVCVRSSSNIYNQSLVASMLATEGMQHTETWLEGLVANFARTPAGGDRDQIKAVAAGLCDVAIVNSYYLGGMLRSSDPAQLKAASSVGLFWPNQDGRGTHINISGAGVTRSSQNPELAAQLIAFLASDESQRWYAEMNNEFPVRADIEVSETLRTWGGFDADQLNVTELGRNNANAIMAMDRAGWK
ncbi:MAG: Fe(3+) ABC transporter substrate-binding protein [Cellvibrionales bacterium]|nr:Fe(3+) ABC transporter substrate-binding protein [Porticoccaceae bacterium]|tara:strand:+ start:6290 stop:7324 length:1035 start_codon:yes stop_codon:yes gene_type:complete